MNKTRIATILLLFSSSAAQAAGSSLHCKLFEIASGKMLTMGGAYPNVTSGSSENIEPSTYALIVDRTKQQKPLVKVLNHQKKAVLSARFDMEKKESQYPNFALQLSNELEGLRVECNWAHAP